MVQKYFFAEEAAGKAKDKLQVHVELKVQNHLDTTVSHALPMRMECAAADVSVTLKKTNEPLTKGRPPLHIKKYR